MVRELSIDAVRGRQISMKFFVRIISNTTSKWYTAVAIILTAIVYRPLIVNARKSRLAATVD